MNKIFVGLLVGTILTSTLFVHYWIQRPLGYVDVYVDCSAAVGKIRSLQGVNTGPSPSFPLTIRPNIDLSDEYGKLGVDYVRIHDFYGPGDIDEIFPDFNADPMSVESYNFTTTDRVIERINAIGAKAIFRLGYSWAPNGAKVRFINESDYDKWAEIVKHIIMHYNDGWADGFHYNIEYWEIWNEPDLPEFWTGTPEQYFRLYETVAKAIKAYDPDLKVGGPAAALSAQYGYRFIEGFIEYCATRDVPLAFVSWHHYQPPSLGFWARLIGNPAGDNLLIVASKIQVYLNAYHLNSSQLLTEWNLWLPKSESPLDRSVYACSALIRMEDSPIAIATYYRGDAHWLLGLFDGNGDWRKPAYAFKAFDTMLETPVRVRCTYSAPFGYAAIAGISSNNSKVAILISNFETRHDGYHLIVENLPWGNRTYTYERYLLDESHDLTLVETGEYSGNEAFIKSESLPSLSFQLIILTEK